MSIRWFLPLCSVALLMSGAILSAGESVQDAVKTGTAAPKQQRRSAESSGNWEVHRDVAIQAGKSAIIDSTIDFSTLDRVAVTVRSDGKGDGENDLGNITLKAYWSVPEADYYTAADVESGKQFPYTNSGGVVFQAYGSQFRLVLKNEGQTDITLQQVIVFARSL